MKFISQEVKDEYLQKAILANDTDVYIDVVFNINFDTS
jgi:hypothetical protein